VLNFLDHTINEKNQIDATIADPTPQHRSNNSQPTSMATILKERRKVERKDFAYHSEGDYYECPAGDKLMHVGNNGRCRVYRAKSCTVCELSQFCVSSKKRFKQLHRDRREKLAEKMHCKLQTDQSKIRMMMRAISVEPVFGNIKQNLGFRRFNLRGLRKVKGEFNLMCIAHNLNILFKTMPSKKRLAAVMRALKNKTNQYIAISKNIVAKKIRKLSRVLIFSHIVKYA